MKPWVRAIVPLKDLVQAKSRLSGLLSASERRALAQAMAEDVLQLLVSHPAISAVTLVSDDPAASLLADRYALDLVDESQLGVSGLNPVLEAACDRRPLLDGEACVLVHGDVPLFSRHELGAILDELATGKPIVIGTDRHGGGTNLLGFRAGHRPVFQFGVNSRYKHEQSALACDSIASVRQLPGLSLDVDEAADLGLLMASLVPHNQGRTGALLSDTELGRRLGVALAEVYPGPHMAGER